MDASQIVSSWIRNDDGWKLDANGNLQMSINGDIHQHIVSNLQYQNFYLESVFRMTEDDDGIGFTFDFKSANDYKQLIYSGGGIGFGLDTIRIYHVINGVRTVAYADATLPVWKLNENYKLRMEVVYDVLQLFHDDQLVFNYKLPTEHIGSVGFYAYSQQYIARFINVDVLPSNRMGAKFRVIGSDYHDVFSEILIRQGSNDNIPTEISIRVEDDYILETVIDIAYGNKSDVLTEIQPYGWKSIPVSIEVRPHNRMKALYEIQEPPKITDILNPVKDAFTREKSIYQTINYGATASLNVGSTEDDRFRSYLKFDFSTWNPYFVIIESKLRLHYAGSIPNGVKIELLTLNEVWQEYGITHVNRPDPIALVSNQFINNSAAKYIEFEVTDLTEEWIKQLTLNEGVVLRYNNESDGSFGYLNFKSRESSRPPELLITYYDGRVFSGGRSQVPTEIFVWQKDDSDILTEIEVAYSNKNKEVLVELEVHRYESPVTEVIEAEITITKRNIWSEITISVIDDSDILVEISPRLPLENIKLAEITVSKPFQFAEIEVKYKNNIPTVIEIQRYDDSDVLTEIGVTRDYLNTEIYVRYRNDIPIEIEVQRGIDNDIYTEISINREKVLTELEVRAIGENEVETEIEIAALGLHEINTEITVLREHVYIEIEVRGIGKNEVDTELTVRALDDNSVDLEISISRELVHTEIEIRGIAEDDIETEILIRAIGDNSVDTSISISRPDTLAEITVTEYRDIEVVVEVKYRDDVLIEITAMSHSSIFVEIEAIPNSNVLVELSVSRPSIWTEIHIPYFGNSNVLVELTPRLLRVSDIYTLITVRSKGGAYAFII